MFTLGLGFVPRKLKSKKNLRFHSVLPRCIFFIFLVNDANNIYELINYKYEFPLEIQYIELFQFRGNSFLTSAKKF